MTTFRPGDHVVNLGNPRAQLNWAGATGVVREVLRHHLRIEWITPPTTGAGFTTWHRDFIRHINDLEVTTMSNDHAFPIGAKIKVAERHTTLAHRHSLRAGETYTVESCRTAGESGFMVKVEDRAQEYGSDWFVYAEAPQVPRVRFSLTKDTSREYAANQTTHKARVLDDDANATLKVASQGLEVDAADFRDAVIKALSAATTRDGASPARRERAKQCRHLLYIVNAVLDNARAGLPPVDPGARSPRIAELEAQVARLEANRAERDGQALVAADRVSVLEQEVRERREQAETLRTRIDRLVLERGYVADNLLSDSALAQLQGYRDGLLAQRG